MICEINFIGIHYTMMKMVFNGKPTRVAYSPFGNSMIGRIGTPTNCSTCPGAR